MHTDRLIIAVLITKTTGPMAYFLSNVNLLRAPNKALDVLNETRQADRKIAVAGGCAGR